MVEMNRPLGRATVEPKMGRPREVYSKQAEYGLPAAAKFPMLH
jgi:hypothetical protein